MEHNALQAERFLINRALDKRIPINGSLELLPLCNMDCDMCYVRLSRGEMEAKGRLRTVEEWLSIAKEMQKAGTLFLLLTGGEPFLYPGFDRLYLELLKMGFILTINTNGTLIDEKWAEFLSKNKPRRLNVTLYGANEEVYQNLCHYPGGFEKTLRGIRLLKAQGVDVRMNASVTKANVEYMDEILKIADDLGVPVNIDHYMMPGTREREKAYNMQSRMLPKEAASAYVHSLRRDLGEEGFYEKALNIVWERQHAIPQTEEPGRVSCLAGRCTFAINWKGEMRSCVILTNPAMNVFEMGFQRSWEYIAQEISDLRLSSKCTACELRFMCDVCAAGALLETGDFAGTPNYMCEYTKEKYRLMEEYVNERA